MLYVKKDVKTRSTATPPVPRELADALTSYIVFNEIFGICEDA